KPCSVVSESLYYCARRRSSSALLATTRLPVGAVDDERCRRHWVPLGSSPQSPSHRNQPHYPATKTTGARQRRKGAACPAADAVAASRGRILCPSRRLPEVPRRPRNLGGSLYRIPPPPAPINFRRQARLPRTPARRRAG